MGCGMLTLVRESKDVLLIRALVHFAIDLCIQRSSISALYVLIKLRTRVSVHTLHVGSFF